jgi:sporulation protein YlmC with PRC-barrel domain
MGFIESLLKKDNKFIYFINISIIERLKEGLIMSLRLSKLFGMDIYDVNAGYKGKVYDLIINLEKGKIETITTEPLKVKSKSDAKKILSEKSVPYKNVRSAKDIIIVGNTANPNYTEATETKKEAAVPQSTKYRYRR